MIAAMMTAANLGARVTGWGFVVFMVSSICWTAVGIATGQPNLLATNAFLTLVNLVGIWRWLGRQRGYEDGGKSAETSSRKSAAPTLFTATGIAGMTVVDTDNIHVGRAVEALIECGSEQLRAVNREAISFSCDRLMLAIRRDAFDAIAPLKAGDWPATAVAPTTAAA